ncbi:MAG: helix-turn-helix domain-containing protein [Planctomycetes bacterium]|nr:helix-turn-helix domain-containing protein [Planctomycetota bacterium]
MLTITPPTPQRVGLLTSTQVCEYLAVSIRQLQRLVASGELPCRRMGRRLRFDVGELQKYFQRLPAADAPWRGPAGERDGTGRFAGGKAVRS